MDGYSFHAAITNSTMQHLRLDKAELDWGKWVSSEPPADIAPGLSMIAIDASGKSWVPGGTTGTVVYVFRDDANVQLTISWDVPASPGSTNTLTVTSNTHGVDGAYHGFVGSGPHEAVVIEVLDGR